MIVRRNDIRVCASLLLGLIATGDALAQASLLETARHPHRSAQTDRYPLKPIRLIVPFPPGGGTDVVSRTLAQKLTEAFGQPVIVDNRPGAGGAMGAESAVRAAPDAYTLMVVSSSYATNAAFFNLPYDAVTDVTPISMIADTGFLVALHPNVEATSIRELIELVKTKPGVLNYGAAGIGSLNHLAMSLFDIMAGTRMTLVPYKGTAAVLNDLLGGQIQLTFGSMPAVLPLVKANRLRGIGVTTLKRNSAVPELPAIHEILPGYETTVWFGVLGPRGLPKTISMRWRAEIYTAMQTREMKQRLADGGLEPSEATDEAFREVLKRDIKKWKKVVAEAGIKPV